MYTPANRVFSTLTGAFVHGTDTSLALTAVTNFPAGGGYIRVYEESPVGSEWCLYEYTGISALTLTGLTTCTLGKVESTAAHTFAIGTKIEITTAAEYLKDIMNAPTIAATYVVAASDSIWRTGVDPDYVCDGADDQVEIQAAIDAIDDIGGGTVRLLAGTFNCTSYISLQKINNMCLIGAGMDATIINQLSADQLLMKSHLVATSNIIIEHLTLDGNNISTGLLNFGNNTSDSLVQSVRLRRCAEITAYLYQCYHVTISNCIFEAPNDVYDLLGISGDYNIVENCKFDRTGLAFANGIANHGNNFLKHNYFINAAISFENYGLIDSYENWEGVLIDGNRFIITVGGDAIAACYEYDDTPPRHNRFKKIVLINNYIRNLGGYGIRLDRTTDAIIENNTVLGGWIKLDKGCLRCSVARNNINAEGNCAYCITEIDGDHNLFRDNVLRGYTISPINRVGIHSLALHNHNYQNLFTNGDFEVGDPPTGWDITASAVITQENTIVNHGQFALKITSGAAWSCSYQDAANFARYKNRECTVAAHCYCPSINDTNQRIGIQYSGVIEWSAMIEKDDAWHWISKTVTIPDNATMLRGIFQVNASSAADTDDILYIDNAFLVEGEYCPEDLEDLDEEIFNTNIFQYPAPGTDWTPQIKGAGLVANRAAKKMWMPLSFLQKGDRIIGYKLIGDAVESTGLALDCKLVRINKTNPITTTDITGGGIAQIDNDGNFTSRSVLATLETVEEDKGYALEFLGTTGAGDSIIIIEAEIKIFRSRE